MITLTGLVSILILLVSIYKTGKPILLNILNPIFWILISYFQFFGMAEPNYAGGKTDWANLFGLLFFLLGYRFFKTILPSTVINKFFNKISFINIEQQSDFKVKFYNKFVVGSLLIVIGWAMLDIYFNYVAYGDLNKVFLRFYYGASEAGLPAIHYETLRIFTAICLISLFSLRLILNKTNRLSHKCAFWLSVVIYIVVVFPSGTVGKIMAPFVMILIADALAIKRLWLKKINKFKYVVVFAPFFLIGVVLLNIRGGSYNNVDDLFNATQEVTVFSALEKTEDAHSIVFFYTDYVLNHYGESKDFLGFHTFYAIAVNLIPRSLWEGKPNGFGRILAIDQGAPSDTSISFAAGIAGEGYANLGWPGILFLGLFIGGVSGGYAKIFEVLSKSNYISCLAIAFLNLQASFSFVRGDMLSAWAASLYRIIAIIFILIIIKEISRFRFRNAKKY